MNTNLSPHKITIFIYNKQIREKDVLTSNLLKINFNPKTNTFYNLCSQSSLFITVIHCKLLKNVPLAITGKSKPIFKLPFFPTGGQGHCPTSGSSYICITACCIIFNIVLFAYMIFYKIWQRQFLNRSKLGIGIEMVISSSPDSGFSSYRQLSSHSVHKGLQIICYAHHRPQEFPTLKHNFNNHRQIPGKIQVHCSTTIGTEGSASVSAMNSLLFPTGKSM